MPVTITWNGDSWMRKAVPAFNAGLTAAAAVFADKAGQVFGTEGGGVIGPDGSLVNVRRGGMVKGFRSRKRQRYQSSPPGTFPGYRTGNLARSQAFASPESLGSPLRSAFGTGVAYGRYLQTGTRHMAARPWIWRVANDPATHARASQVFTAQTAARLKAMGLVTIKGGE